MPWPAHSHPIGVANVTGTYRLDDLTPRTAVVSSLTGDRPRHGAPDREPAGGLPGASVRGSRPRILGRRAQHLVRRDGAGQRERMAGWEAMAPDKSLLRIAVDDPSGHLAAFADIGAGGAFQHPDGAQSGGVWVARADRG